MQQSYVTPFCLHILARVKFLGSISNGLPGFLHKFVPVPLPEHCITSQILEHERQYSSEKRSIEDSLTETTSTQGVCLSRDHVHVPCGFFSTTPYRTKRTLRRLHRKWIWSCSPKNGRDHIASELTCNLVNLPKGAIKGCLVSKN